MFDTIACYLGVEKGAVLAPFFILISSIFGSSVAYWAIKSNRRISRLKNSMDFLNSYSETDAITEAIKEVHGLEELTTSEKQKLAANNLSDELKEKTKHIRTVLNYYESLALCIHHRIYDEIIIKEAVYTTIMDVWDICGPYVHERRKVKKKNTFYQELEVLIEKWKYRPLKEKKPVKSKYSQ